MQLFGHGHYLPVITGIMQGPLRNIRFQIGEKPHFITLKSIIVERKGRLTLTFDLKINTDYAGPHKECLLC